MTLRMFTIGNLILLGLLIVGGLAEHNREWKRYQRDFFRLESHLADTSGSRTPQVLKINQIDNPDLGIIDRCPTCHLAVEDPRFRNAPEPFRTHPDFEKHSFDRIGCTICHAGQGAATTKEAAHGEVEHWKKPLLENEFIQSSCVKCHKVSSPYLGSHILLGKKLFLEKACIGCHRIDKQGGNIGPDLTRVGEKRTPRWLIDHFKNPQVVVAGSKMPKLDLSQEEIRTLTTFMLSRVKQSIPDEYLTIRKPAFRLTDSAPLPASPSVELGAVTYGKYGCLVCHGPEGKGGVSNPNSMDGVIPSLLHVSEGLFSKEILDKIVYGSIPEKKTPEGADPLYIMPSWRGILTDVEVDSLVLYLTSLLPETVEEW